jgi:hypothetical protein
MPTGSAACATVFSPLEYGTPPMKTKRAYTASEIREIVEMFRDDPDVSSEKFSGMEFVADALKDSEAMSDTDIEENVRRFIRSGSGG